MPSETSNPQSAPRGSGGRSRRGPRRDRRGRGLRGDLAPRGVPLYRSRSAAFDDLVLDAVEEIEQHWTVELADVEFAVQDVPPDISADADDADVVIDRQVALGRLFREGLDTVGNPVIVIYRRPVEARTENPEDRADLVFLVVAELVAELLGRDIDEIDPPHS